MLVTSVSPEPARPATLVEHDQTRERRESAQESRERRLFPRPSTCETHSGADTRSERPVADDLVSDVEAVAARIPRLRLIHDVVPAIGETSAAVRAVVQRVSRASSTPGGAIGAGLCVLLGVADGDDDAAPNRLAGKIARLRIFEDDDGRFDRSLLDTGGAVLVVSQFTLIADSRRQRGTRPDFSKAARREQAEPLYERFCDALRELGVHVETGVFGARMRVEIVNDGPVTLILEV